MVFGVGGDIRMFSILSRQTSSTAIVSHSHTELCVIFVFASILRVFFFVCLYSTVEFIIPIHSSLLGRARNIACMCARTHAHTYFIVCRMHAFSIASGQRICVFLNHIGSFWFACVALPVGLCLLNLITCICSRSACACDINTRKCVCVCV